MYDHNFYYVATIGHYGHSKIGPYLKNMSDAISFRKYIYKKIGKKDKYSILYYFYFNTDYRELYKSWEPLNKIDKQIT